MRLPLTVLFASLISTAAFGQVVVYSDFGTNNSFSTSGSCVSGPNNPDCGPLVARYIAAPFTPVESTTLSGITLPLTNISGTNGAVISLLANSGGTPGAVLESWSVSNLPISAATLTSVTSRLNPALEAGQTYWVEVQPLAIDTMDFWFANNLGLGGGMTDIGQTGWIPSSGGLPAFAVNGTTASGNCTSLSVASNSPQSVFLYPAAGSYSWSLIASPAGCSWQVTNISPWISLLSPSSGTGSGTITASFAANTTTQVQVGSMTVTSGSISLTLYGTQDPVGCQFSSSVSGLNVPASGGTYSVTINSNLSVCDWYFIPQQSWIQTTNAFETGTQTVSVTVSPNSGPARTGYVNTYGSVADISVPVYQAGTPPPAIQVTGSLSPPNPIPIGTLTSIGSLSVASSDSTQQISFNVSSTTTNTLGGDWLKFSVSGSSPEARPGPLVTGANSGTTPATINVSADMTGFAPGTYTGAVSVTPTSRTSNSTPPVPATARAIGNNPISLIYAPANNQTLDLNAPASLNGLVQVKSEAVLDFNVSPTIVSGGNWLQLSQSDGTAVTAGTPLQTNALLTVSPQPGVPQPGVPYETILNFIDTYGTTEYMLTVTLSSPGLLIATPTGLSVTSLLNGSPINQSIALTSSSPDTPVASLSVKHNTANSWLTANLSASATPASISVSINPTGLTAGTYSDAIVVTSNTSNSPQSIPVSLTVISPPPALQLLTLAPCRVMDTRLPPYGMFPPNSQFGPPYLAANTPRTIPIPSGGCGVPANAMAYSLNITVAPRNGKLGSLTVWPTNQPQPLTSNLTSPDGQTLADAAVVPAGTGGSITASVTDDTDLIVDINGYFVPPAPGTLQFYPLPPCRVLDTRPPPMGKFPPNTQFGSPSLVGLAPGRSFPFPGSCGVPTSAAAYSLNVTVAPPSGLSYLTAWPTGQPLPTVSTMNSFDGTTLANAAIVPAGTGGALSFYADDNTDLIVDINGYFAPPGAGGLNFYPLPPCRLVDTRNPSGAFGGPTIAAGNTRSFPLAQGSCAVPGYPAGQAYSLTVTALPQGVLSYLTAWPTGGAQPEVSTLNGFKGIDVANAAIVPSGPGSAISVFVLDTADVLIDTAGYFGP